MTSGTCLALSGRNTAGRRRATGFSRIGALILGLGALGAGSAAPLAAQTFSEFAVPGGSPSSIATGPDGKVWFTEPSADKIGRISMTGVVEEFTLPAGSHPQGIAAGPDGNMWFAEESGRIGRITPSGFVTHFSVPSTGSAGTNIPFGIAAGPDGNLWFTKPYVSQVGKIDTTGVITVFPLYYQGPFAITGGPDGNVWFTVKAFGESKICRITPAGVNDAFGAYGQLRDPGGIVAGPDGNLWFTEGGNANGIGRITPSGVITQVSLPSGRLPVGIVAGSNNDLWFTENTGNRIGRITTSGVITDYTIPTAASGPTWIARGPDGNLWFSEESVGKIGRFSLAPPGCLSDATSLCLGNGRFRVRATWSTADGSSGDAQAVGLTSDAGYFTFFSAANVELVTKVVNGCGFNSHFWVFASGLTNVHVVIRVVDSTTGESRTYENPLGTAFQSIQDTSAFASCP